MPTITAAPDATLPLDMIIFGGAGDLSIRKLLPALYMAHLHGNLPSATRIIAVGRHPYGHDGYIEFVQKDAQPFIDVKNFDLQAWQGFLNLLHYVCLDATDREGYAELARLSRPGVERVFYLATAPTLFTSICDNLAASGLVDDTSRVVLEKPLGHDLNSAREINLAVGKHFSESQIYRIDHYLGKETVQNLMVLRFGNGILEPLWRAPNILSVQITVAETVGVGSRAGFYDGTGALRDMVQNHLLQLLCIIAMEPPVSLDPDAVRDEKLKVLRSLRRMSLGDIARDTVRGQYGPGAINGEAVKGYLDESGVPNDSHTETFVALHLCRYLALGQCPVLPAYRQAFAEAFLADRHRFRRPAVFDFYRRASHSRKPPCHPVAAGRIGAAAIDGQATRERHAHAPGESEPGSAIGIFPAPGGSVRAPADRCGAGTADAFHAPR